MVQMIDSGSISGRTAKDILPEVMNGANPEEIVEKRDLSKLLTLVL